MEGYVCGVPGLADEAARYAAELEAITHSVMVLAAAAKAGVLNVAEIRQRCRELGAD